MASKVVEVKLTEVEAVKNKLAELTARAERAEAAIASVRALHVRIADTVAPRLGFTAPDMCGADWATWPCPTIAALDSTDPEPAPKEEAAGSRVRELAVSPNVWVSFPGIPFAVAWEPTDDRWQATVKVLPHPPLPLEEIPIAADSANPVEAAPRAVIVSDGRGGKTIAEEHDVDLPRGQAAAIRRSDRQPTRGGTHPDVPAPGRSGEEKDHRLTGFDREWGGDVRAVCSCGWRGGWSDEGGQREEHAAHARSDAGLPADGETE